MGFYSETTALTGVERMCQSGQEHKLRGAALARSRALERAHAIDERHADDRQHRLLLLVYSAEQCKRAAPRTQRVGPDREQVDLVDDRLLQVVVEGPGGIADDDDVATLAQNRERRLHTEHVATHLEHRIDSVPAEAAPE